MTIGSLFDRDEMCVELIPEKAWIINVKNYQGDKKGILARVVALPGIYAWYRDVPHFDDPTAEDVIRSLCSSAAPVQKPRSPARMFGTYDKYSLKVHSRSFEAFSNKDSLTRALDVHLLEPEFSSATSILFKLSMLFMSPLYIGATTDLKVRIDDHLSGKTDLRGLLDRGVGKDEIIHEEYKGIDIFSTRLLFIITADRKPEESEEEAEIPGEDDEDKVKDASKTLEEVAQRLYRPPYVRRIG